jgi:hypothetical protein
MLQIAFKEWAVICAALAEGKQAIILRKGGIAEDEFGVEHTRFWLYPTYVHQQDDGIIDEARPLLESVQASRPPAGKVRLQLWAEVTSIYRVRDELLALMLPHLHCWSEETVRKRFNYRAPGVFVLAVRVHRLPTPHEIDESPAYAGCKSWVELTAPLSTEGSTPVLSDDDYRIVLRQLDRLLAPTALA